MYVCGVTVYDDCHVGHGRVYVTFDVVRRFLEFEGYDVKYVVNFTDIDDKIIDRAEEVDTTPAELSRDYTQAYFEVMDQLNIRRADVHPTVTGHVPKIIEHVQGLLEKDMAYEVDGDVYFDVEKFDDYGKLSGQNPGEMQSGSRVDVDDRKRSPLDFALWKSSEEGEPAWESPWGEGRPGWHIECSVMSRSHLGDTLDIHGGGRDLIFPHHENEVAQTEALTGKQFSRYWMHNGFVTIDDEKMSKSEGNFYTLKDIFYDEGIPPRVVRYFYLTRHYRSPLNFSFDRLEEAKKALRRLDDFDERLREAEAWSTDATQYESEPPSLEETRQKFLAAMRDDFNTAEAIGHVQEWMREWNGTLDEWIKQDALDASQQSAITSARDWLEQAFGEILGIRLGNTTDPITGKGRSDFVQGSASKGSLDAEEKEAPESDQEQLLADRLRELRDRYRENNKYEVADKIRDVVEELGWGIEDSPKGSELVVLDE
jgi:cysteinyl-tRNA synthetase